MRKKLSLLRWFVSDISLLGLSLICVSSSKLKAGCNTESKYVAAELQSQKREHRQCLHISPSSVMLPIRPRRCTRICPGNQDCHRNNFRPTSLLTSFFQRFWKKLYIQDCTNTSTKIIY